MLQSVLNYQAIDFLVKRLLVRKSLSDGTKELEKLKTKDSEETVSTILSMVLKKQPEKFPLAKTEDLLDSLKKFAQLKEYIITLQWNRQRKLLLNVQKSSLKKVFYLHLEDYAYN